MQRFLGLVTSKPANFVLFNSIWASCVLGGYSMLWLSLPFTLAYLALLLGSKTITPFQLVTVAVTGIVVDSLFTATGLFQFSTGNGLIPLWLVVLWLAFATTLPLAMSPLGRFKSVAVIAGAVGFPLNYSVGAGVGVVEFAEPQLFTLLALASVWAVLLPLLFFVVEGDWRRMDAVTNIKAKITPQIDP